MMDLLYFTPLLIAILASVILLFYGFERKNKKAVYIYFGFFVINTLLLFLHILAHKIYSGTFLLLIMKFSYITYLIIPPLFSYAVSEIFLDFCYLDKKKMNILLGIAAIFSLMMLFSGNVFIQSEGDDLTRLYPAYALMFIAYYSLFIIQGVRRFRGEKKKRIDDKNHQGEKGEKFSRINISTLLLFSLMVFFEVAHQLQVFARYTHYFHELSIISGIVLIFYNSFKYHLIEIEKSMYIFSIAILSLLIISGSIYASKSSEDELKKAMLDEFEERQKTTLSWSKEEILEYFEQIETSMIIVEQSRELNEYGNIPDEGNAENILLRLSEFEKLNDAPICFISSSQSICSAGFNKEDLKVARREIAKRNDHGDFSMSEPFLQNDTGILFLSKNIENIPASVLITKLNTDRFDKVIEEHEVMSSSHNWIIDQTGFVIADCKITIKSKNIFEIPKGEKWIDFSMSMILDDDGKVLITNRERLTIYGREWIIGVGTPTDDVISRAGEVFRKTRNSSLFAITFIFAASTAVIMIYVRYSRKLNVLVDKKTIQIEESKKEIEKINSNLEKTNKDLNRKLRELEDAKRAMFNLLKDVEDSNVKLRSVDDLKTDFMNISSHELKTPLISIMGYTELLMDSKNLSEEEKNSLAVIHRNSERLKSLISDILMISKLESGNMPYTENKIDLKDLLNDALSQISPMANKKNIMIEQDIKSVETYGDKELLSHIFPNLLSNAVKFTPENGKIKICLKEENDKIIGIVEDTGVGIPKKFINNLFQKFYQVDSSRDRKFGGTGLGLSICKQIIEIHRGIIRVESEEGEGSKFIFEIPKKKERQKED